jgi:RNA polymerase-interacting CarD/CdnL/TRCF family regulator
MVRVSWRRQVPRRLVNVIPLRSVVSNAQLDRHRDVIQHKRFDERIAVAADVSRDVQI